MDQAAKTKKHTKKRLPAPDENQHHESPEQNNETSRKRKKQKKKILKQQEKVLACARNAQFTGSVEVVENPSSEAASSANPPFSGSVCVEVSNYPHRENSKDSEKSNIQTSAGNITHINAQPLLVLDLNGLLCHRIREGELRTKRGNYRKASYNVAGTPVIPRPKLQNFLTFLDANFCLSVWTSAKGATAKKLVEALFPETVAKKLLFVWGQSRCKAITSKDGGKPVFIKLLDKVWEEFPIWSESNTLLIDDSPDKCPLFRDNALHPPPMHGIKQEKLQEGFGGKSLKRARMSDADNDGLQKEFFAKLVDFWKLNQSIACWDEAGKLQVQTSTRMLNFLQQNATGHMGWRSKGYAF